MPEHRLPVNFGYFLLELFTNQARRHGLQVVNQRRERDLRPCAEKQMYVVGFSFELNQLALPLTQGIEKDDAKAFFHLFRDRLAAAFDKSSNLDDFARQVFGAYNAFLDILSDKKERGHLDELESSASDNDPLWEGVRDLGLKFQEGLDALFLDDKTSAFPSLIRKYGVF